MLCGWTEGCVSHTDGCENTGNYIPKRRLLGNDGRNITDLIKINIEAHQGKSMPVTFFLVCLFIDLVSTKVCTSLPPVFTSLFTIFTVVIMTVAAV